MTPVPELDVLQWTMGWSWPIIVGLGVLVAWGIGRFMTWDEQDRRDEQKTGTPADNGCVCWCGGE